LLDPPGTLLYRILTSIRANPAKAGAAKLRVLASSATPPQVAPDATKDPTIAELPKGRSAFVLSAGAAAMSALEIGLTERR
jgi:hypothetical protein